MKHQGQTTSETMSMLMRWLMATPVDKDSKDKELKTGLISI